MKLTVKSQRKWQQISREGRSNPIKSCFCFLVELSLRWLAGYRGSQQMSETAENLKLALSQLAGKDRAELAHFLIHSLDEDQEFDEVGSWETELERRLAEIKHGKAHGEPGEQVLQDLHKKHT
jgi:putative addiction module component (TIGR02574 family)